MEPNWICRTNLKDKNLSESQDKIVEVAPAKVNLYLHIRGRRPDGMHLIDSLIVFADQGDIISVSPSKDILIDRCGPMADGLPPIQEDLVYYATNLLAETVQARVGAKISIKKNLPIASGIGGGSADAAATIRALLKLWKIRLTSSELLQISHKIGADAAVCLQSRPTRVTGIGEKLIETNTMAPLFAVLVNPRCILTTKNVFSSFCHNSKIKTSVSEVPLNWAKDPYILISQLKTQRNDLTEAAISLCPVISNVLNKLQNQPDCLLQRMSGSGATCFGLFPNINLAKAAAEKIKYENDCWWVKAVALNTNKASI